MKNHRILYFLITVLSIILTSSDIHGQSEEASPGREIADKIQQVENNLVGTIMMESDSLWTIQSRMSHYNIKGVSIAVIHNYKVEWAKGYGWADDSAKIPVTAKTLFQAASISKSLNSVGVLKLAQEKKLDIYADINQYLTSWKFPYDSISKNKKISTISLLSHTAGLNVHGFAGYARSDSIPTILQILNGNPPANSDAIRSMLVPGLRSEYSGGGITISQLIVMDITHKPYAGYMYENVLKPLGMISSSYEQPNKSNPDLLATGYRMNGDEISGKYHIYPEEAAAGLWTNPTDLGKYIIETQLAWQGKSSKVLNQEMTKLRLTPYQNNSAALGVFIDSTDGGKYFQHGGANEGFRCQYFGTLTGGDGLVVMVNSDNGAIIQEIVNSISKVYHMEGLFKSKTRRIVQVDGSLLQSYTGKYNFAPQVFLTVTLENGLLFVQLTGQPKFQIYPESQNKFFLTVVDAEVEFVKNETGQVSKAVLYQNGMVRDAPRVK
jgi:CubicO group peptidase (beta-lactamase class C family)